MHPYTRNLRSLELTLTYLPPALKDAGVYMPHGETAADECRKMLKENLSSRQRERVEYALSLWEKICRLREELKTLTPPSEMPPAWRKTESDPKVRSN
jgi:hypothetical protein